MTLAGPAGEVVIAFADDELLMGHRHSEWLGVAPFLEEDLAYASIAQDELGHARALYGLAGVDADEYAFRREPGGYRSAWLVELPCTEWADALARHFFYDVAEQVRWRDLARSGIPGAPELAAKALREEEYHLAHAVPLVQRLLNGTSESRRRVTDALERLFPFARALFEPLPRPSRAANSNGLTDPAALEREWLGAIDAYLRDAGLTVDLEAAPSGLGGRSGARSEHFADLHATMTSVLSIDPGAVW